MSIREWSRDLAHDRFLSLAPKALRAAETSERRNSPEYLKKPVEPVELAQALYDALHRSR